MQDIPLLLLFDLDGTLVDSRADLAAATNRMRALHGLPPIDIPTVVSYVGDGLAKLAERALQGAPVDPAAATREIGECYAGHETDATRPYPGVDAGLRALHAAGHRLGLVTNKPARHARAIFGRFGWTPLFAAMLAGGDTPALKPAPDPILEAMHRTGIPPSSTWMVGDHHTDLEAARRAGVSSVFLLSGLGNTGAETPTLTFRDFSAFVRAFLP
ncbi:MAG: HAD-IA family hydrolase [Kiritimatiellae bacterium]|nr:HAD-IA family hydrolase [Kiritimatiellia bacterium]